MLPIQLFFYTLGQFSFFMTSNNVCISLFMTLGTGHIQAFSELAWPISQVLFQQCGSPIYHLPAHSRYIQSWFLCLAPSISWPWAQAGSIPLTILSIHCVHVSRNICICCKYFILKLGLNTTKIWKKKNTKSPNIWFQIAESFMHSLEQWNTNPF